MNTPSHEQLATAKVALTIDNIRALRQSIDAHKRTPRNGAEFADALQKAEEALRNLVKFL